MRSLPSLTSWINKQSCWEVFANKLMKNKNDKSLIDYINIKKRIQKQASMGRRKANLQDFLDLRQNNARISSFAYPSRSHLLDSLDGQDQKGSFNPGKSLHLKMKKQKIRRSKVYTQKKLDSL